MDRIDLPPLALLGALALLLLAGGGGLADALVETDDERLAEIVAMLERDGSRVDRLAAYADAERVPVLVGGRGRAARCDDRADLRERLHEELAPLDGPGVELVQVTHELSGDEGRITLRVRGDGEISDLELTLRREGQSFLLVGARRIG